MIDSGVKVLFVTHLYDLANSLHARRDRPTSSCALNGTQTACGPSN